MRGTEVPARAWFASLALAAFGLVAAGQELQQLWRLAPCPLCIFQRVLFLAIGAAALAGVLVPKGRLLCSALVGGIALGGIAVAGYQTWMQAYPHLAPECSFTDPNLIERLVDWLGMRWPKLFLATGFCSSRDWEFLGLSLANWSVPIFAAIAAVAARLFARAD